MASEMRRAAKALVEPVRARFVAARSPADALACLRKAVEDRARLEGSVGAEQLRFWEPGRERALAAGRFEGRWFAADGEQGVDGLFLPSARMQAFLRALSLLLALLVLASVFVLPGDDAAGPAARFLVPLSALFAILGFPLLILALASAKLASEARIAKAIRACLAEADSSP